VTDLKHISVSTGWFWDPGVNPAGAIGQIVGGPLAPEIRGYVLIQDAPGGCWVFVSVAGLPPYRPAGEDGQPIGPHGFHVHECGNCEVGNAANPFQAAGGHWNPDNQPHGNHAGDFPVLFSHNGQASMSFFTNRFTAAQVIGRSVIIHESPDDYRSQPAGNAGKRLACGAIKSYSPSIADPRLTPHKSF
jgi:Cu-Zn family superoxide dismutase